MAVIRVNSTTGFNSDDLFGPTTFSFASASTGENDLRMGFSAYGPASTTSLWFTFGGPVSLGSFTGSYSQVTALASATVLATLTYATAVVAEWADSTEIFYNPKLLQFADPNLPAIRLAGVDDIQGNTGNDFLFGYGEMISSPGLAAETH